MNCAASVKTVDVSENDNKQRGIRHRGDEKPRKSSFGRLKTYLHRDGKAASAGFPAGISVRRESAAEKLGLKEGVLPFSPCLEGQLENKALKDKVDFSQARPNSLAGPWKSSQTRKEKTDARALREKTGLRTAAGR